MSFHLTIDKPRKGTGGQYTICEVELNKDRSPVKSKFIKYSKDNDEAKKIVNKYCEFHFIDSIFYANGKEKML